jgi:hypothetical protein
MLEKWCAKDCRVKTLCCCCLSGRGLRIRSVAQIAADTRPSIKSSWIVRKKALREEPLRPHGADRVTCTTSNRSAREAHGRERGDGNNALHVSQHTTEVSVRVNFSGFRFGSVQISHPDIRDRITGYFPRQIVQRNAQSAIDSWMTAAGTATGTLLRCINKAGRIWGTGFSPKSFGVL